MKKLILLMLVTVLMGALFAVNANALLACDWVTIGGKIDNTTLMAGELMNISYSGAAANDDLITIYINASSVSTANSSVGTFLISGSNNTGSGSGHVNASFITSIILEDATDYIFECACEGSTTARVDCGTTISGITVDRTVPQNAISLSPSTSQTNNDITFSATVIGENTTACTLYFNTSVDVASSFSMTHTDNTCSKTLTSLNDQSYIWSIETTDGTNSTRSQTSTFSVKTGGGTGGGGGVGIGNVVRISTPAVLSVADDAREGKGRPNVITEFLRRLFEAIRNMFSRG